MDASAAVLIMDCAVTGTGGITKIGSGIIDMGYPVINTTTALNTFSGGFTLNAGTLEFGQSSHGSLGNPTDSPVGTGTLTINGGTITASSSGPIVTIANSVTVNGVVNVGTKLVLSGPITFNNGSGLVVNGSLTFAANAGSSGIFQKNLSSTTVNNGGVLTFGTSSNHSNRTLVVASSFSLAGATNAWMGAADLGTNDLIVKGGNITTLTNQFKSGYNGGNWNGSEGFRSSAASMSNYTSLGVIPNKNNNGYQIYGSGTGMGPFDGYNPTSADVIAKYTYQGDANLDGVVDGSDYSLIDNGYNNHLTGWLNGDFNYDGTVNSQDYTIIDNGFHHQGGSLALIEAMPHWKIPGYSALYLPIYTRRISARFPWRTIMRHWRQVLRPTHRQHLHLRPPSLSQSTQL